MTEDNYLDFVDKRGRIYRKVQCIVNESKELNESIQEEIFGACTEAIREFWNSRRNSKKIKNNETFATGKRIDYDSGRYLYVAEVFTGENKEEIAIDITDELFETTNRFNEGPKTDNGEVWRDIILHTDPGDCWVRKIETEADHSFELSKEPPEIVGILSEILNTKNYYYRNNRNFK